MKIIMRTAVTLFLSIFLQSSCYVIHAVRADNVLQNIQKRVDQRSCQASRFVNSNDTRSIKSTVPLQAAKTAFGGEDRFFLAGATGAAQNALARASITGGNKEVVFVPLAPEDGVIVNDSDPRESPLKDKVINALTLDAETQKAVVSYIDNLGTNDAKAFVFVVNNDKGTDLTYNADPQKIRDARDKVFDDTDIVTTPVLALAANGATGVAGKNLIVAAVAQQGLQWDGISLDKTSVSDDRGFSVLQINSVPKNLKVIEQGDPGASARRLHFGAMSDVVPVAQSQRDDTFDPLGRGLVSFYDPGDPDALPWDGGAGPFSRASVSNAVDMYWDKTLERLYIGLSDVTRGSTKIVDLGSGGVTTRSKDVSAGVCSVLVGSFDGENKLTISPVIKNVSSYLFPDALIDNNGENWNDTGNIDKYIIGGYARKNGVVPDDDFSLNILPEDKTLFASARKVRTMHTSTGKAYLIVNGGVVQESVFAIDTARLKSQMYAIPLCQEDRIKEVEGEQNLGSGVDTSTKGFVARNDDLTKIINLQPLVDTIMDIDTVKSNELNTIYNINAGTFADGGIIDDPDLGTITGTDEFRDFIKNVMPLNSRPECRIGGVDGIDKKLLTFNLIAKDPFIVNDVTNITDVYVHGDTVYIAVGSPRDFEHQGDAGIFASTALFYSTGEISGWTPWAHVMGRPDASFGLGFDGNSSNFWYFTTADGRAPENDTTKPDTVKVTQWGKGDATYHKDASGADSTLSSVLDASFVDIGGVLGLFNFGPDTPGFRDRDPSSSDVQRRHEQFSMMVATGNGRVALIETGSFKRFNSGIFNQTITYEKFDPAQITEANVYVFDAKTGNDAGIALERLGKIYAAEVSRLPNMGSETDTNEDLHERGWLFVGGENGLAVFVNGYSGKGWDTREGNGLDQLRPGPSSTEFPAGRRWNWLQIKQEIPSACEGLNVFQDVRKLVSDGDKFLYIVTAQKLLRIEMSQANFMRDPDNSNVELHLPESAIATLATMTSAGIGGNKTDQMFDIMVLKRDKSGGSETSVVLLATSKGVFQSGDIPDDVVNFGIPPWTTVTPDSGNPFGPAILFEFASTELGGTMVESEPDILTASGNLHVSAFDPELSYLARYRFEVENGNVTPFAEQYLKPADATSTDYFYKMGDLNPPKNPASAPLPTPDSFVARTALFPGSQTGFVARVPVRPSPDLFLKTDEINLKLDVKLPMNGARLVRDDASGSVYIPGQFGVRVNE